MKPSDRYSRGQGLVEYALIIVFIAIVVVTALIVFGQGVGNLYSQVLAAPW